MKSVSVQYPAGSGIFFFTVDFSAYGGTEDECQVAAGDSGGPVFSKNGGTWELTGIQVTRTLYTQQPYDTALFGNESWSVQLSDYRDQILDIVELTAPACSNGVDDDGDGLVDHPDDPGCLDLDDAFERRVGLPCDDGFDNDGDAGIDFDPETYADPGDQGTPPSGQGDPGCASPRSGTESPQCQDGIHNDADRQMDYDAGFFANGAADPNGPDWQCLGKPWKNAEPAASTCGLGSELAFLLPLLIWLRRRPR